MAHGWIEQDDHGFRGCVRLDDGRRRSKRFPFKSFSRREAKKRANDWQVDLVLASQRGGRAFVDPKHARITYGAWIARFQVAQAHSLRRSTLDRDTRAFDNHILPVFKDVQIGHITPMTVQDWINELNAKGLAPASVQKYYHVFRKSLVAATARGLLPHVPCDGVELPRIEESEMHFLTPDEVSHLSTSIDARYASLVLVASYCGLRIGELAALRRSRLDLEHNIIDVRETSVEINGIITFGAPKTRRGARRVPMNPELAEIVAIHLKSHEDEFVFPAPEGGPFRTPSWRARFFKPAAKKAKLLPLTPHDLRHSAISIWIANGVPAKEIAVRAGHGSAAVVLDRYGHLFPESDESFRESLSNAFVRPKERDR